MLLAPLSKDRRQQAQRAYTAAAESRQAYEQAYAAWLSAPETRGATAALTVTVTDLERRGLLQYDRQSGHWDLHPVVRAIAFSGLRDPDRDQLGRQIVDYFSQLPHNPYEQAETLDDLRDGITIVRTLLQMGRRNEAWKALGDALQVALLYNVEAYPEFLSILRPLFPYDWYAPDGDLDDLTLCAIATSSAQTLCRLGEYMSSVELEVVALRIQLKGKQWQQVRLNLNNLSITLRDQNQLALSGRYSTLALRLAETLDRPMDLFRTRLLRFEFLALTGLWDEAEEMWNLLNPMGRDWPRRNYRPGDAELSRLESLLLPQGRLTEQDLAAAQRLARTGYNRYAIRRLHRLCGEWRLVRREYSLSAESLQEAIQMAHETGLPDPESETMLALARFHLDKLPSANKEAFRLSDVRDPAHLALAELWHALGDADQAINHARAAYVHASADGEPYVRRYHLDRAEALLLKLGGDVPDLPAYDPGRHSKEPWEDEIAAAIAELRESDGPQV